MIGERLQELRKDKGLSQADFAKILGVSHYTVSSYECNRSDPDDKAKIKIAELFNVSIDYLVGLIDEPVSYIRNKNEITAPKNFDAEDIDDIKIFIEFLKFKKIFKNKNE